MGGYYTGEFIVTALPLYEWKSDVQSFYPTPIRDDAFAKQTLIKCYDKLNSAPVDLGVMLAELGETLHMLRHPFEAISKNTYWKRAFKRVRPGINESVKNYVTRDWIDSQGRLRRRFYNIDRSLHLRDSRMLAADMWLQFRYGIMPLMRDIESIISHFNRQLDSLEGFRSKRAMAETDKTGTSYSLKSLDGFSWMAQKKKVTHIKSSSVVYFKYRLNQTGSKARYFGLDYDNVPTVVWEKIHLSFVIDWFINVSRWLTAIKADPFHEYLGNCTSQVHTVKCEVEPVSIGYLLPSGFVEEFDPGKFSSITKFLVRTVNDPLPVLPVINADFFNYTKTLDSLTLIWQKIAKRR